MTLKELDLYIKNNSEILERIKDFQEAVLTSPHNLVASTKSSSFWERHILDSAQLYFILKKHAFYDEETSKRIVDVGSGAGLPGIVLSLMGMKRITLIESIQKKAAFLDSMKKKFSLNLEIHPQRIEDWTGKPFQIVIARAVKNLRQLLMWCMQLSSRETIFIFPKGRTWKEEVELAELKFSFDLKCIESLTGEEGKILVLKNVKKL